MIEYCSSRHPNFLEEELAKAARVKRAARHQPSLGQLYLNSRYQPDRFVISK